MTAAGEGTVAAATEVHAWVWADGSEQIIGSADVEADGSYMIEAEAGHERVIVQAMDSSDQIIGSVLRVESGADGETVIAAPITSETSVEAEAYIRAIYEAEAEGWSEEDVNMAEVLARIDTQVAASVAAYERAEGDASAIYTAMAEAIIAAHATQRAWLSAEGMTDVSHDMMHDAMADATIQLYETLHADGDAELARDSWLNAMADAWTEAGLSARARVRSRRSPA